MKSNKIRILSMLLCCMYILLSLAGCASGSNDPAGNPDSNLGGSTNSNSEDNQNGNSGDNGPTELTFWISWVDNEERKLQVMVDDFNNSQTEYTVKLVKQGGIEDIRNKLASTKQSNYPAMFCGGATTPAVYAESSYLAPLQGFIDNDSENWTETLFPTVKASYCDRDGNLLGHPIGVSCAGYAVNTDLLGKAGYTTDDLTSFEKMVQIATEAVEKGVCTYGISFQSGVDLLDMLTLQGVDFVDNGNGWEKNATKALLDQPGTVTNTSLNNALELVASLYGDKTVGFAMGTAGPEIAQFINGNLLFWKTTNSTAFVKLNNNSNVKFNWEFITGVGVDEDAAYKGQALSEGTGIYICNTGNEKQMQGAYEFVKFLAKPENKLYWAQTIGYVAYSSDVLDEYSAWADANYPSANKIVEKLRNSDASLRLPYINANVLSANWNLMNSVTTGRDIETAISEASIAINNGLKLANLKIQ